MAKAAQHQQHYNPTYQAQHPALPQGEKWEHLLDNGIVLRGEFIESAAGPSAPVLHFAHGNGLCARVYEHFLAYAHPHFALFLHDSQGHGASDNGDEQQHPFVGWNGSSARMVEVIRQQQTNGHLKGRRLFGGGHSFGGALTYLAAAKNPGLFEHLSLFDAMMFPPGMSKVLAVTGRLGLNKHTPLAKQARNRGAWWQDMEAAFHYFYKRGMLKTWHDDSSYSYLNHSLEPAEGHDDGGVRLRCAPWIEASIFSGRPAGLWKKLKTLSTTTELFFGEQSYPFLKPSVERCARINPNITAIAKPGNHFFMLENPACLEADNYWAFLAKQA